MLALISAAGVSLSATVWAPSLPPPFPFPLLLPQFTLRQLQPSFQDFHLLFTMTHFLEEAVFHQPGYFKHGWFEDGLHDNGELRLECEEKGFRHRPVALRTPWCDVWLWLKWPPWRSVKKENGVTTAICHDQLNTMLKWTKTHTASFNKTPPFSVTRWAICYCCLCSHVHDTTYNQIITATLPTLCY